MRSTMLAVVNPEAAPGAEIREVKIPAFGRTDILVKVKVASISCGAGIPAREPRSCGMYGLPKDTDLHS